MKFIITGYGRVGTGLARTLSQHGHIVTVIDRDPVAVRDMSTAFKGQVLLGSAFDREVLLQACIERADGLAAVTGSDETNVAIARLASGDVDLVETEVPLLLVGRTVNEVTIPGEVHVTAISRGGKTFLPTSGTTFQEGDLLHIAVLATSAYRLDAFLAGT